MYLKIIFWISAGFILYTYIGYPLLLFVWSTFRNRRVVKGEIFPEVSVVIAALNEEKDIKARINNLLEQDYPLEKIEIIVVSDGSTDRTEEILRSFEGGTVTLYSFEKRKGKAEAINYGVSRARGEIIVFTDARQRFKHDAVKQLVSNFNDPEVGAATGELFLTPEGENHIRKSIGIYWEYEKWVRKRESRIDSVIGVTGAIYAIRKSLYEPIPADTILDDVLIPMRIVIKGFRVIMDDQAYAFDSMPIKADLELGRKQRTLTGNFQMLSFLPEALSITRNRLFLNYISHKLFRLLIPHFLVILFLSSLFILEGIYAIVMILQLLFYVMAFIGYLLNRMQKRAPFFIWPYTGVLLNYAAILAFLNFIRKNHNVWIKRN